MRSGGAGERDVGLLLEVGVTRLVAAYSAAAVLTMAVLVVAYVLNRLRLVSAPRWAARFGRWAHLLVYGGALALVTVLSLGATALLAWVWRDREGWNAWPMQEARMAVLMAGPALGPPCASSSPAADAGQLASCSEAGASGSSPD